MAQIKVYGIIGRKHSGKDTVANIMRNETNCEYKFLSFAFADNLKRILKELFGFPNLSYFTDQSLKEVVHPEYSHKTPRELMQWFGTDLIRANFGADFWIKRLKNEIEQKIKYFSKTYEKIVIVITDVRFKNEASFLENEYNASMVYVDADERLPKSLDNHCSENEIYKVRDSCKNITVIKNNKTVADLNAQINKIF